jgi:hypothetical protein
MDTSHAGSANKQLSGEENKQTVQPSTSAHQNQPLKTHGNVRRARFHEQFVQALNAGASAYANAEANVVRTLVSAVPAPSQAASANPVGSLFQQLETAQINFNTNLVNNELAFNHALVTNEVALEKSIFGTDSALNGALNRSFNVANLLVGTGEQALNTVVGAPVPTNFTFSLLLGSAAQVFNDGAIGGPLGAFDQSLVVAADVAGLVVGSAPAQAVLSALPAPAQALRRMSAYSWAERCAPRARPGAADTPAGQFPAAN